MLRNIITISLRAIWRNKFHTAINIIGLAIGVSACMLLYLIVSYELSFNKQIKGYEQIYRIHSKFTGTFSGINRGAPSAAASYVRENFRGVEHVALFFCFGSQVEIPTHFDTKNMNQQEAVAIVSADYFNVFDNYDWVIGTKELMTKPNQVVLTEGQFKKYFGNLNPQEAIGREIVYRDSLITRLAGIVGDLPFRTDIEFTDFISMPTIEASWLNKKFSLEDWSSTNSSTQIFIKANTNATNKEISDQLPQLTKRVEENSNWDAVNHFNVQPLSDLHYNAEIGIFDFSREPAHMPTLLTLIVVAILLLLIAAINFVNLATAQAVKRAKEVGVRKVLGSSRSKLIIQFVCEGLIITLVAVMLALPITEFSLTLFADFVPDGVTLKTGSITLFLVLIVAVLGLLASAYPAWMLSSFMPALALKNQTHANSSQSRTAFLRKSLIVFQFAFAQVLIFGTVIVGRQIHFMLNKDLGFRSETVVYFYTPWFEKSDKKKLLQNEIESITEVRQWSLSDDAPSSNGWSSNTLAFQNGKEEMKVNVYRKFGDTVYLKFYGIQLLAGRNLAHSDTVKEFLINEELMRTLGFSDPYEIIGQTVDFENKKLPVVGVVKDFHMKSLHEKIEPVILANEMSNFSCFNIRLNNTDSDGLKSGLDKIEMAWKKIYPDAPFEYHFLDETIKNFYQSEQRISKLINTATGLAIFISCLGLFGLASFTSAQRTKEIGIRKVMGASVKEIVFLLSKEFLALVFIAFVIALPFAWIIANEWLKEFPYHTSIQIWMYAVTALGAIIVAMITVGYQTLKAANTNPVESLRNE